MRLLDRLGLFQLEQSRPQHAQPDRQQDPTRDKAGGSLESMVTIRMALVGVFLVVVVGKQHDEVGDPIGQRAEAVSNQAQGRCRDARHDRVGGRDQVDGDADPGLREAAAALSVGP